MKVIALGHSAYLLEMDTDGGIPVRILADPWFGDYVIGDLQGRFPRLRFEASALAPLHAIFLSHSHTDHLDPYSLVSLWQQLDEKPTVLLPESLRFLRDLLMEHLKGVHLVFLRDRQPVDVRGLSVLGFFNPETAATNEDDVMVLVARNNTEVFIAESDAVLPLYHPLGRDVVQSLLAAEDAETLCFMTTKNEGDATMSMLSASDAADRQQRLAQSLEATTEEIQDLYAPIEDDDFWQNDRLVRLIGGQGICFPQTLAQDKGHDWNRVLFPIRLAQRVQMEREVAADCLCSHTIEEAIPGQIHSLGDGRLLERRTLRNVELLDREEDREFDGSLDLFEDFPVAPVYPEDRNEEDQRRRILACLNERFLPHLIGARNPPIEHILGQNGGEYRIRIRCGTAEKNNETDYRIRFEGLRFVETEVTDGATGEPDEHYWANDLEDFLDGRCDEFSTICRHPLPACELRLWRCLGLPYLNNDLIEKKLRLHFERASRGESLEEWILGFYRDSL